MVVQQRGGVCEGGGASLGRFGRGGWGTWWRAGRRVGPQDAGRAHRVLPHASLDDDAHGCPALGAAAPHVVAGGRRATPNLQVLPACLGVGRP